MRRFELVEGTASKFWQIEQDDRDLQIRWGRIGTNGQSQTKSFGTAQQAADAATKLINAKTKKGYAEVAAEAGVAIAPPADQADHAGLSDGAPEGSGQADESPAVQAPWLVADVVIGDDLVGPLSSRRFPQEAPAMSWQQAVHGRRPLNIQLHPTPGPWHEATVEAATVLRSTEEPTLSDDALVVAMLVMLHGGPSDGRTSSGAVTVALARRNGLIRTVSAALQALRDLDLDFHWNTGSAPRHYTVRETADDVLGIDTYYATPADSVDALRDLLSVAPDDVFDECVARARQQLPELTAARRVTAALMIPEPELANEVGRSLMAGSVTLPDGIGHAGQALAFLANDPDVITWALGRRDWPLMPLHSYVYCATALQEHGAGAAALLSAAAAADHPGDTLTRIGSPDAVAALAAVSTVGKAQLARLQLAVERFPLAALVALAAVTTRGGREAVLTQPLLTTLVQTQPRLVDAARPHLTPQALATLDDTQARLNPSAEVASLTELPPVLASPPWLSRKKTAKVPVVEAAALQVPDVEEWPEGEREKAATPWRPSSVSDPKRLVAKLARDCRNDKDPVAAAQFETMRAAADAGDPQAFADAWAEHLRLDAASRNWSWHSIDATDFAACGEFGVDLWNAVTGNSDYEHGVEVIAATGGLRALPGLIKRLRRQPGETIDLVMAFGSIELAPVVARCYAKLKTTRQQARAWLLTWPEHAAAALVPAAVGKPGEPRDCARAALRLLKEKRPDVLEAVVERFDDDVRVAAVLVIDQDPLDQLPTRMPTLPAWWAPSAGWSQILLPSGKALPPAAVDAVGTMLALPRAEGIYPGIDQVVHACTRESLAAFAWDVFTSWLAAAAPSKDGWALTTLGLFGTDDTARRITPYLRAWPGEGQHKRAVNGLEVLAGIGSDVSLMQLNGIAQKVRFRGLQDAARAKIRQIADDRGMTTEQLADRLAPDLGLDARGTMELDFGPRTFRVGFDETLAPFVRDATGARLKDLPKARKDDDAALAAEATSTWRQLKKDARTVASQQVWRLEQAMVDRRRWTSEEFTSLLVTHPLVQHLVRRLVWGVYTPAPDGWAGGGELQTVFRVAEDGTFTDGVDEEFDLPESFPATTPGSSPQTESSTTDAADDEAAETPSVVIGVVHLLELEPDDIAAFSELFGDYEIVQPFPQLGRDSYELTPDELCDTTLRRFEKVTFPTGKVRGMVARGWRQGEAQDAGWVWHYYRDLGDGSRAAISLEPGLVVGDASYQEQQDGATLQIGAPDWDGVKEPVKLGTLHPITISELIRDLQIMTTVG